MKPKNYGRFLPYIEPGYNAKVPFDALISGAKAHRSSGFECCARQCRGGSRSAHLRVCA